MLEQGFERVSLIAQGAFYQTLEKTLWMKCFSVSSCCTTHYSETFKTTMFKTTMLFAGDSVGQQFKLDLAEYF